MNDKRKLGLAGENLAKEYYQKEGYTFLQANYYSRFGEIDLIFKNDEYIVFIEVKARSEHSFYLPVQAVTPAKQKKIIQTALLFLQENATDLQPRFDIACVYASKKAMRIEVIENAFM